MENNMLENMTYYQLEERLIDIIHNINKFDYNELRYHLGINTLFNDDKVKLYNKLKSELNLNDVDDLKWIIKNFNKIENKKQELREMLKNINLKDYIFVMGQYKRPKLIDDRELLYNNFIKKYHFCEYTIFVKKYNHRESYDDYEQ